MSKSHFKKPLIGALFATASAAVKAGDGGGVTEGGKSQLGVNHLTLEELPSENIKICLPEGMSKTAENGNFHFMPDSISVVIPPFETNVVKLSFVVSHMISHEDDHVLILIYSQKKTLEPQIPTPKSLNKLGLDLNSMEIVGLYNIPALNMEPQAKTRIGQANPAPRSKMEFDVNLDTTSIPDIMNDGANEIYLQAALLKKSDFANGTFDMMILSEVDTIRFEQNECPEGHIVFGAENESGGKSLIGNTPSYGGGITEGSRQVLGINALRLEEALGRNATICQPENVSSVGDFHFIPDNSTLVVDQLANTTIELNFWVSDILPADIDRILMLGYSTNLANEPQISTPYSLNKFELDMGSLEIIAVYNIPAQPLLAQQPTRIGFANSQQTSKQVIKINLDTWRLDTLIRSGEAKIYVQAWLVSRSDLDTENFDSMILSEVDTIRLAGACIENAP